MTTQGERSGSVRERTLVRAGAVLTVAAILGSAGAAHAVPPRELVRQLTDVSGSLGSGEADVRSALARLETEDGIELYVAVVGSTDGQDLVEWADETAVASGLGDEDPLLVLATDDADYVLNVGQDFELDEADTDAVTDAIEDPFARGDYAAAVVAATDEMRSLAGGGFMGGGSSGRDARLGWLVWGAALLGILLVVGFLWLRSRQRRAAMHDAPSPWGAPPTGAPEVPIEELNRQANRMLVATDEDVRGAERELAFAQAEFGDDAVQQFAQALGQAKASVVEGFSLRQRLDDSDPETEQQQREMLQRVVALCNGSRDVLTSQAEAFAELRDLAGRIPELVSALTARADTAERALPHATETLADLTNRFSPAAVEAVAQAPAQAAERLSRVRNLLAEVSQQPAPSSPKPADAVPADAVPAVHPAVAVRSAEEDLSQAEEVLAAVDRVAGELQEAGRQLPRAISALTADVQALRAGTAPEASAVAEPLARAEAALGYAEANGRVDPMGSLTRLTESDAALDRATASARALTEQVERARAALPEAISAAQARVAAAVDLINVNRGQVGGTARTRASEASRVLADATATATGDPVAALAAARRALDLALAAEQAARADMSATQWGSSGYGVGDRDSGGILEAIFGGGWSSGGGGGWSSGGGGGWSGSSSRRSSSSSRRSSSSRSSSSRRSVSRSSSSRRSSRRR